MNGRILPTTNSPPREISAIITQAPAFLENPFYHHFIGQPKASTENEGIGLRVAAPVFNKKNVFLGILIIDIDFRHIAKEILADESKHTTFLLDSTGNILYQSTGEATSLLDSPPDNTRRINPELFNRLIRDDKTIINSDAQALSIAVQKVHYGSDLSKNFVLIGNSEALSDLDIAVTILRDKLFWQLTLSAFIICSIAFMLSNHVSRPIRDLTRIAGAIAKGEMVDNFDIKAGNEIGELADAFKLVLKALEERSNQLTLTYRQLLQTEKLGAIGMLTTSIAHEFGSPIFAIRNILTDIQDGDNQPNPQMIPLAIKECNRLRDLLDNLKKCSQPSSGRLTSVNIHDCIDSILLLMKSQLQRHDIEVVKHFAPSPPLITGIEDQIRQVFLNILTNAEKAIDGKGGSITISTAVMDQTFIINIKDTGCGIPKPMQEKIFSPFCTTRESQNGSGLGLTISNNIIEQHGGKISVQSSEGKGATFTITLPLTV